VHVSGDLYPPADPHRAPLSEVASWTVRSDRDPSVWYTVELYPDGHWECSCPGRQYQARADGLCKHIDRQKAAWAASQADLLAAALCWSQR
jgi:hypothetical protein